MIVGAHTQVLSLIEDGRESTGIKIGTFNGRLATSDARRHIDDLYADALLQEEDSTMDPASTSVQHHLSLSKLTKANYDVWNYMILQYAQEEGVGAYLIREIESQRNELCQSFEYSHRNVFFRLLQTCATDFVQKTPYPKILYLQEKF